MILEMEFRRIKRLARMEEKKEIISTMASMQMPIELITQVTRSTPEFVKSVLNQNA